MGTKIFDYIGLKRKILFCFTDDSVSEELKSQYYQVKESTAHSGQLQAELIQVANAGILVKDASELKDYLLILCMEFNKHKKIQCQTNEIDNYSRRSYVEVLVNELKKLNK